MSYTISCSASSRVVENLLRKFSTELAASMPEGKQFTGRQVAIIASSFIDQKFPKKVTPTKAKKSPTRAKKSPTKATESSFKAKKAKKKSEPKPRLTVTHNVFRIRNSEGMDMKGKNGAFLRVAVNKETRFVQKVNVENWTAPALAMYEKTFGNRKWQVGSRQPTKTCSEVQRPSDKKKAEEKKSASPAKAKKAKKADTPSKLNTKKLQILSEIVDCAKQLGNPTQNITQAQKDEFCKQDMKSIRDMLKHAKKAVRDKKSAEKKEEKKRQQVAQLVKEIRSLDQTYSGGETGENVDVIIKKMKATLAKLKREKKKKETKAKVKSHDDLIKELLSGDVNA